ncbi:MAG: hypothetical protein ACFFDN_01150 [Candidatus Hodarchaeota archaeon]
MRELRYNKISNEFDKTDSEIKIPQFDQPSKKLKIFFWIILGCFSVFFAEVISGSSMLPFFEIWGLTMVLPLYTLHTLILAHIVFKQGKPNLYTLFLAGMLFGMYEAYITKVLWEPPWNASAFSLGGVAVFEFFILVFWWHAFFAFIFPLLLAENLLTKSRDVMGSQPERVQNLFATKKKCYLILIIFAIWCGGFQSMNSLEPAYSVLSGILATTVLGILILIWRKKTNGRNFTIYDLLPNKIGFYILFCLLITYYIFTGIFLRPEAYPDIIGHISIWIIYSLIFILFYFNLKKSKVELPREKIEPAIGFSWKLYVIFSLIFTFSSATIKIFPPISVLCFGFGSFFGIGIGIILFILSIKKALK